MFNNFTETELKNERWKDIDGYDGAYQVSDLGRVRSLKFGKVRVLRFGKNLCGYLYTNLCKDGKYKTVTVHRLVASYFVENDNIFNTEINHRNEDKTDNRALNLEWCDRSYNVTYNGINRKRKNCKRDKIKDLYRPYLSIAQNIELFRANGIECSRETVRNLRKDLGLIK